MIFRGEVKKQATVMPVCFASSSSLFAFVKTKPGTTKVMPDFLVVVTGLEPVTTRTSSECATSCAKRPITDAIIYYNIAVCQDQS